jgi:ATP phosphoribosyltransferase regulatory subunit
MNKVDRWLLPDGIEELLPPQGMALELARRKVLDQFHRWGYELVVTPMVEFLDSLLTGTGSDLDLKTFKVTDQVSGRTLGIRADITPQVARMDAHSLRRDQENRLCYVGTVLHAKADNMLASRAPISIGAELFGDSGTSGDLEIVSLMLDSIASVSSEALHVELGDVGIYRSLMADAGLSEAQEAVLFEKIQGKAIPDLKELLVDWQVDSKLAEQLLILPSLCGDESVIDTALDAFEDNAEIVERISNLISIALGLKQRFGSVLLNYDLSELRGYNYHTGIVFAAFLANNGVRVAKGGRYDDVGQVFGRARGATGFDMDLKALVKHSEAPETSTVIVSAPPMNGSLEDESEYSVARFEKIAQLRETGFTVIESETESATKRLILENEEWVVVDATNLQEN